ncbi:MAG: hypothetical protein ACOYOV_17975, partial [Bacteroidales bacterium]
PYKREQGPQLRKERSNVVNGACGGRRKCKPRLAAGGQRRRARDPAKAWFSKGVAKVFGPDGWINSTFLNGGTISSEIVPGTSELSASQAPQSIAFTSGTTNCLKIAPRTPPRDYTTGISIGTIINSGDGNRVCRVKLINTNSFEGNPASYSWNFTPTPYNTIVSAFVSGSPVAINTVITSAPSQAISQNTKVYLEGLFNGTNMNKAQDEMGDHFAGPVADVITVQLAEATAPYNIVRTFENVLLFQNGMASFSLPQSESGPYFLVIKHRNSVETWSAAPISFSGSVNYDFTNAASSAYADNLNNISGKYVIFVGDVTQDGIIDGDDLALMDPDVILGATGYIASDLDGGGYVDGDDIVKVDPNIILGISIQRPY